MIDYHIHTSLSDDSQTPFEQMLDGACRLGLTEVAITDHDDPLYPDKEFPFPLDRPCYHRMLEDAFLQYRERLLVKRGLELGLQQKALKQCRQVANEYPYDFIIGSFHTSCGLLLDNGDFYEGKSGFEIHRAFYTDVYECLSLFKDYSVVGHLNIVDRYLHQLRPQERLNPPQALEIIEEILKMIIYDGKGIELNTSSFRYGLPILTPSVEILQMYRRLGGEIITLGSDAHSPEYIADHFDYGLEVLERLGYRYISTFSLREPSFVKLTSL